VGRGPGRPAASACKQRGYRLRRKNGPDWWRTQPWYVTWCAERDQDLAEQKRAREEKRRLDEQARQLQAQARAVMSPEARAAFDRRELAEEKASLDALQRRMVRDRRRRELTAAMRYEQALAAMSGKRLRFGDPCDDDQIAKLLNHAVSCDSDVEAATFFEKARRLWRAESESASSPGGAIVTPSGAGPTQ
jgi:hypothetical protein